MRRIEHALWAAAAPALVLAHATALAALHVLEPQVSSSAGMISDYARTGSGWLAAATFMVFAGVWASVAISLGAVRPRSRLLLVGRGLLVLAVVGITLGAIFPSAADPRTDSALARLLDLVARPGLFVGVLLVSVALLVRSDWSRVGRLLTALATLGLSLLVVTVGYLIERDLGGVGQRALFVILYVWVVLLGREMGKRALARAGLVGEIPVSDDPARPRSGGVTD
jgi:hypothetical protein